FPDAAELPGDHEIQPGGGLCAGDRPFRRPPARRTRLRAALAAAGTGAVARRTAGTAAAAGPTRPLQGHAGRPVRRADPGGAARLPGLDRDAGGRICLFRRPGTAAGALNPRFSTLKVTPKTTIWQKP